MKTQIMSKRGRRFDEGGEVQNIPRARTAEEDQESADKSAGLAASNKEKAMGFFERLRAGNIDDPTSEAYKRFGAGRGRADRAANASAEKTSSDAVPPKIVSRNEGMDTFNKKLQDAKNNEQPDRTKTYETGLPANYSGVNKATPQFESAAEDMLNSGDLGSTNEGKKFDKYLPTDAGSSLGRLSPYTAKKKLTSKPANKKYDPTAGEAQDRAAQAAADEQGDRPKTKPVAKPVETASKPKKDMYRNFSGKMVEKTPDIASPMAGLGSLIGRGAKAMGEAYDKYEFMTPAKRIAKENKEKREARGNFNANKMNNKSLGSFDQGSSSEYKRGGSVASSRADGIAQRGKTRGRMR